MGAEQPAFRPDFYPRPPGGGRPRLIASMTIHLMISIHALRVEGDDAAPKPPLIHTQHFYPRPPGGGRRMAVRRSWQRIEISIHALRVEGDHF